MKQFAVFIALKVMEIGGVLLVPYLLARGLACFRWYRRLMDTDLMCMNFWMWELCGIVTIISVGGSLFFVVGVLAMNWQWAASIYK